MESLKAQFSGRRNQHRRRDRTEEAHDHPSAREARNRHSLHFDTDLHSKSAAEDAHGTVNTRKCNLASTAVASEPWKQINSSGQKKDKRLARLVDRAQDWVLHNAVDEKMSVTKMASALNTSRTTLHRKLVLATGQAPGDFIREVRMQLAYHLLTVGECNVSQAAYAVGFVSLSGFSRAYRLRFGVSPSKNVATRKSNIASRIPISSGLTNSN